MSHYMVPRSLMSARYIVGKKGFIRSNPCHKFLLVVLNELKFPASLRELSDSIGCDENYVHRHLTQMKRKGILVTIGKHYKMNANIGWSK